MNTRIVYVEGYKIEIFSDCQSAVQVIKGRVVKDALVNSCVNNFETLLQTTQIDLYWVRGHDDNTGNEFADMLAKAGNKQVDVAQAPVLPIPQSFVKTAVKNYVLEKWQTAWNNKPTCKQSKLFMPAIRQNAHKVFRTFEKNNQAAGGNLHWPLQPKVFTIR